MYKYTSKFYFPYYERSICEKKHLVGIKNRCFLFNSLFLSNKSFTFVFYKLCIKKYKISNAMYIRIININHYYEFK